MSSPFDTIKFGSFGAEYHRNLVCEEFKQSLTDFLTTHLLPQIDHETLFSEGTVKARGNDDRYCGPNSAVRNCFFLKFVFRGPKGNSEINEQLWYKPDTHQFTVAMDRELYLWTPSRKKQRESLRKKHEADRETVRTMMREMTFTSMHGAICPLCGSILTVHDAQTVFEIHCPKKCFRYNGTIDISGKLVHHRLKMV